jgi:hypothetical protein
VVVRRKTGAGALARPVLVALGLRPGHRRACRRQGAREAGGRVMRSRSATTNKKQIRTF